MRDDELRILKRRLTFVTRDNSPDRLTMVKRPTLAKENKIEKMCR